METVQPRIFSVAELNNYLREYLAEDDFLRELAVRGEIAGFKAHSSGHIYFNLREQGVSIKTVMFRSYAAHLDFLPEDGMEVVVIGGVALFERDGVCQLYATMLLPAGAGVLAKAKDKLKQTLQAEGLFAPQRKKPIPAYAENIGVITSGEGAAWADIQKVAYSRWPGVRLQLYAAAVQGTNAPSQLAAALAKADQGGHDVLICGRGGGSTEDLAAFDSEQVVRAIAAVATPLISAVGHEVDVTLADLVADMRAATPSQGAELAVFSAGVLRENLAETEQRFKKYFSRYLAAQ
ncbi:MAG: exodeoxyribonuclease VII large subunit, partial [Clostridiales bacterium]